MLSFTGLAFVCGGFILGFAVGALCSHLAASHRLAFGLAGNFIAATTWMSISAVYQAYFGNPYSPSSFRDLLGIFALVTAIVCVPGLLGSWGVMSAKKPAALPPLDPTASAEDLLIRLPASVKEQAEENDRGL